jgi:hypothetical protein
MLSIILLNYNSSGLLKYALRGLASYPPTEEHEIIVVDNASRYPAITALPSLFPSVRILLLRKNRGYAAGNNAGIAEAVRDRLLILNPDIVVFPKSIDALCQALAADRSLGVVGPKLMNPDGSLQYSCHRFYSPLTPILRRTFFGKLWFGKAKLSRDLMMDWDHEQARDVDWLMGSALLLRRTAVEQIGGLDERFFLYFEDMDWCRRFWQKGWKVRYVPQAVMAHYHQRLSARSIWRRHTRIHILSALKYFAKHGLGAPEHHSL